MVTLRKTEMSTVIYHYEVELTDDQLKLYKEDDGVFWDEHGDIINDNWEYVTVRYGDSDTYYELKEEEE